MPIPAERKRFPHGALENVLIAAAVDLVETRGTTVWSVRELARAADVSPAAPHYYFRNRDELAAAVAEEGFVRLAAHLEPIISESTIDPVERLASACLAYVQFAIKNPGLYRAMYASELHENIERDQTASATSRDRFERLLRIKAEVFGLFVDLVRDGQKSGQLRSGAASDLARLATSLAHGLAHEFIDEQLDARTSRQKHAREVFALMLSGLTARDPR